MPACACSRCRACRHRCSRRFLAELRVACLDAVLFGWTPGLAWDALKDVAPGTLDFVASSLPWWDGRGDWLWRELETLRRVAPVIADAGEGAPAARRRLSVLLGDGWMTHDPDAAELNRLREASCRAARIPARCPPPGEPVIALELTDQPDPRRAHRAGIALLNLSDAPATVAGRPASGPHWAACSGRSALRTAPPCFRRRR